MRATSRKPPNFRELGKDVGAVAPPAPEQCAQTAWTAAEQATDRADLLLIIEALGLSRKEDIRRAKALIAAHRAAEAVARQ